MDFDRAYANSAFIPDGDAFPAQWRRAADLYRPRGFLDLAYGPLPRNQFDLFWPQDPPQGLFVFVHGGYWLGSDRRDWSHLAAGAVARGWACSIPSYTLAPQARISQITAEIDAAICAAATRVDGPIVVAGHSAGGHLAARMANPDRSALVQSRIKRVIPISPLADLAPLMHTKMNADLRLDAEECAKESPARHPLTTKAHIWVGAGERPAFLWQARTLSENWSAPWTVAPDKHHFNVIDDLCDPTSALMNDCLNGL